MKKFIYETRKVCPTCQREVDATRSAGVSGLRFSYHFVNPDAEWLEFCEFSNEPVKVKESATQ